MPENAKPHTRAAGSAARKAGKPPMTSIKYDGRIKEKGAQRRPTSAERDSSGNLVTPPSMTMGMPMEPNATGTGFASRQMLAAKNGSKPQPTSNAAAMATGLPNPAAA